MIENDIPAWEAAAARVRGKYWRVPPVELPACPPEWAGAQAIENRLQDEAEQRRKEAGRVAVRLQTPEVLPGASQSIARRWQRNALHQESKAQEWAGEQVGAMPDSWAGVLLKRWREGLREGTKAANLTHLRACSRIKAAARAGVPADANDGAIIAEARASSRDMGRRLDRASKEAEQELPWPVERGLWASMPGRWSVPSSIDGYTVRTAEQVERLTLLGRCLEALHWLEGRGIADRFLSACRVGIPGALRRVVCESWWRRTLRRVHAKGIEATARAIGLVNKRAGCYASDDTVSKRRSQNIRNAKVLDSVAAINDRGQEYTLADLAAKGTANKEIRRCELMTRIAGFELIAKECGHIAYMLTVTTPSRMHAYRSKPGSKWAVEPNPKHDGTQPDEAQRYLTGQWAKFRAAAQRAGLGLYGFRIAEPNHDGTPHWHCLFFMPERTTRGRLSYRVMVRLMRRYFLWNSDGRERGARAHRVQAVRIDWSKGSAVGYVAKYVSKNIDGHKVEKDLYGNDAMTSSQRVEAWAACWGIRQFQQIGGAPVGVWRELRRVHREQAQASELVAAGLDAVNITADRDDPLTTDIDREQTAAHGWQGYTTIQGGPNVKRAALRLRLQRDETGELGRYGELMAPRVVGVAAESVERVETPAFGIVPALVHTRRIRREVESERCAWVIVPKKGAAQAVARVLALPDTEGVRPWSPVNNCTDQPAPLFAPSVQRVPKLGRFSSYSRGRLSSRNEHAPPESDKRETAEPATPDRDSRYPPEYLSGGVAVH